MDIKFESVTVFDLAPIDREKGHTRISLVVCFYLLKKEEEEFSTNKYIINERFQVSENRKASLFKTWSGVQLFPRSKPTGLLFLSTEVWFF